MQPVELDLSGYTIAVVVPDVKVSTGWAYSSVTPQERDTSLRELLQQPIAKWQDTVTNDFEKPVMDAYPEIESIKGKLIEKGALFAMMSGSGSAVFGLFKGSVSEKLLAEEFNIDRSLLWTGKL